MRVQIQEIFENEEGPKIDRDYEAECDAQERENKI